MTPNPYEPHAYAKASYPPSDLQPPPNRTPFALAALGAFLASAYWAALALLSGVGGGASSSSGLRSLLPIVLVVLYAVRGVQLLKGDPIAAKRILFLHAVGGASAIFQIMSGNPVSFALQAIKVAIHIFGSATAYLALRAHKQG
ncbi:MAG: hypothetical protein NVS3B20_05180 [Polyangiales bacterium]